MNNDALKKNIEELKKKFGNLDENPLLKKANDYLSEGQIIDPSGFRNMFFANSMFKIPNEKFYERLTTYLDTYKNHIEMKNGLYQIPHGMEGRDMLGIFYCISKYTNGIFAEGETECVTKVFVQKTCYFENSRSIMLPPIPDNNLRMIALIKKDKKDGLPCNMNVFNALVSKDKEFLTFVDFRFSEISIDIGKCKRRGKMVGGKLCEAYLVCIDFVPKKENLSKCQAYIMGKDPRDPYKPILKMMKAVGDPQKVIDSLTSGKTVEIPEDTPVEQQLSACNNIPDVIDDDFA